MDDITLAEVISEKKKLEKDIADLLSIFQGKTNLSVNGINITTSKIDSGVSHLVSVSIGIEL